MSENYIFNFEEIKIDFRKRYRGRIIKLELVTTRYETKRLRVWVELDDFDTNNVFLMSIKVQEVRPSQFYTFCKDMQLMSVKNQSCDIREVLIDKNVDVKLIQTEDGNVLIGKIYPIEEEGDFLKRLKAKRKSSDKKQIKEETSDDEEALEQKHSEELEEILEDEMDEEYSESEEYEEEWEDEEEDYEWEEEDAE